MKIFRLKDHYQDGFDEYVLGPHELGNEVGYMAWGELSPGATKRLEPGNGHEEIILVLAGGASFGGGDRAAGPGEAFFVPDGGSVTITAGPDGCTYVTAGAHTGHGH